MMEPGAQANGCEARSGATDLGLAESALTSPLHLFQHDSSQDNLLQ